MIRKLASATLALLCLCVALAVSAEAASKPNLVLITIDSARADRMGFLGAKGAATPNLNRLAGESISFEHAYAQAPGTVVSHASILSGSYPQSVGLTEIGGTLAAAVPFLPEALKGQGYKTAAFVGTIELDPVNGLAQGFDRGFETYDAGFRPVIPGDSKAAATERSGAEVVARAINWLGHNAQGPFFLWVEINDASAARASYGAALTAADSAVGKLLAALKLAKADANTAVIVVADHGQSLGGHGEDTHGIFLYDETIHVPLLIKLPEAAAKQAGTKVGARVRLVDVAPTVLEDCGNPCAVANAGAIAAAGGEGGRRLRSACIFAQRPAAAGIWVERAGVVAYGQIPLCARAQAGTVRRDGRSGERTIWRKAQRRRSTRWPRNWTGLTGDSAGRGGNHRRN